MVYVVVQIVVLAALVLSAAVRGTLLYGPGDLASTLGLGMLVMGALVGLAAFVHLGRSFRVRPEPAPGARLVTGGIYRWVRHPMYLAAGLVAIGLAVRRGSVECWLAAGSVIVFYIWKARHEERALRARYADYDRYSRNTALLPWRRPSSR